MDQTLQTAVEPRRGRTTGLPERPEANRRAATRLTPRRVALLAFIAVVLLNTAAYGAVWGFNAYTVQKAARADLSVRLARLQSLASSGSAFSSAGLAQARVNLEAVDQDLAQLQSVLPFADVSSIEPEATISHTLNLGRDVVEAALAGLQAQQTLSPALTALVASVTHSGSQAPTQGLTMAQVTRGQQALAVIDSDWSAALAERKAISPSALASLGDPRLGKLLTSFDKYAPMVSVGLAMVSATLDWSPAALGLTTPFHALLFDMDTDELRATGGFLGNYAEVTLAQGLVTSGIHLHDIYTLDCPNNVCPTRAIPAEYNWFPLSQTEFGLRDSNLNPDFPTFAGLASSLYQKMTGQRIDMVVAITPAIIEDLMRVTGPLTVPQFHVTVTADTLTSLIHYFHQNPNATIAAGVNYQQLGTSVFKAFDVLLSQALMAHVAAFTSSQQAQMGKLLISAFQTKDIQVFVSDTRLEQVLEQLGAAGQVLSPTTDNLMVVDENDGASYINSDMRESVTDAVTLDASGSAHHTLSITYFYAPTAHVYVQRLIYHDFVRVIAPSTASGFKVQGPCAVKKTNQSYHAVVGCQLAVVRGQKVSITVTWQVPHAVTTGKHRTYQLLIQRQAGAQISMRVALSAPAGRTLASQSGGLTTQAGQTSQLGWSANPLLTNTTLTATVGG